MADMRFVGQSARRRAGATTSSGAPLNHLQMAADAAGRQMAAKRQPSASDQGTLFDKPKKSYKFDNDRTYEITNWGRPGFGRS